MILCYRDPRWGSWRWQPVLERWGHLPVFINPKIAKTATFLIEHNEPISTVFFIFMKWEMAVYAVTTRHSIRGTDVAIRLNLKAGGVEDKPILENDWFTDPNSDVAVTPLEFMWGEFGRFDVQFIDVTELRSYSDHYYPGNQFPADQPFPIRYGPGDEVFSVGLFDRHFGDEHATQPVARFGHIALVPGLREKIWADVGHGDVLKQIDAFLVEIASWGGQSGSPIFLRPTKTYKERSLNRPSWEISHCIGMLQGFYPGEQDVEINGMPATLSPLNMGIGIVIPARKITELLMRDDVKATRERAREEKIKRKANPSAASSDPLS